MTVKLLPAPLQLKPAYGAVKPGTYVYWEENERWGLVTDWRRIKSAAEIALHASKSSLIAFRDGRLVIDDATLEEALDTMESIDAEMPHYEFFVWLPEEQSSDRFSADEGLPWEVENPVVFTSRMQSQLDRAKGAHDQWIFGPLTEDCAPRTHAVLCQLLGLGIQERDTRRGLLTAMGGRELHAVLAAFDALRSTRSVSPLHNPSIHIARARSGIAGLALANDPWLPLLCEHLAADFEELIFVAFDRVLESIRVNVDNQMDRVATEKGLAQVRKRAQSAMRSLARLFGEEVFRARTRAGDDPGDLALPERTGD